MMMGMGRDHQAGADYFENVLAKLVPSSRVTHEDTQWVPAPDESQIGSQITSPDSNYVGSFTGFVTHDIATNKATLEHIIEILYDISDRFAQYAHPDIELWGGAINDVSSNATSFAHRNVIFNVGVLVMYPLISPMPFNCLKVFLRNLARSGERKWLLMLKALMEIIKWPVCPTKSILTCIGVAI